MAARPPIDFTTDFEARMIKVVQRGLVDAIRAADTENILGTPSAGGSELAPAIPHLWRSGTR